MLDEITNNTYLLPLYLERKDKSISSVICISKKKYIELFETRNQFLHSEEIQFFNNLKNSKRKHSYLQGRYCAKHAIAHYIPNSDMTEVVIQKGVFEQPIVHYPPHTNIQVSISHSDYLGGAVVFPENHPMGIDIESVCNNKTTTIHSQLTSNEKLLLNTVIDFDSLLTIFWTAKEALSKVLKCGFTISFELLEIEKFEQKNQFIICNFTHFIQYQTFSFFIGNNICTIALPRKTIFEMESKKYNEIIDEI